MKTKVILLALVFSASTWILTAQDSNLPRDGQRPPRREGGPGGPGGFHLLPPPAQEQLNLTSDQQKQIANLETELRVKLEKILTPAQLQQLKQMRPPHEGAPGDEGRPLPSDGQRPPRREGDPGSPGDLREQRGGPGGMGSMGGQRPVMPIIEALDLNQDGTIDAGEIAKASASLKKLDKNNDGKIMPDEYRPQRPGGFGGPGQRGGRGGQGDAGAEDRPQRPALEK